MPERTIEDRLREEYFDLLPEMQRVVWQLEAEIRLCTVPILITLKAHEQIVVKSRIKDCESAIKTLARISQKTPESHQNEGRKFDPSNPDAYSVRNLPDLAGVRVLDFPGSRLRDADEALRSQFPDWTSRPLRDESGAILAQKYFGYCQASSRIQGEYPGRTHAPRTILGGRTFGNVQIPRRSKFESDARTKEKCSACTGEL